MEEKEKKPKIRFKGFAEAWEQRKLNEISEIIGGGTPSTENFAYWDGDIDWYAPAEINGQIYVNGSERKITKLGLEKSSAKLLPANKTVLFTSRAGIGKTAILKRTGATNQGFQSIVLNSNTDTYFVYSMTNIIKDKAEKIASGSTFAEISGKMLGNLEFMFPKMEEQKKIGEVFNRIDNLITLHQRKYDKLVNVKKSLLEKMFPKNGSNIPEIRFKGFTEAWEQRKFSNIFEYERPDKYIVNSDEYVEISKTPVLTANKAFILGYTLENNVYKKEKESIIFDDFTLDIKFVDFPYMVKSSAIKILTLKNKSADNLRFNYELLSNTRFNMLGHARHYISVVQPEEVYTTKKTEQDKMANLFSNLDNLITLHQRKLEKLKNIKKSLLEKMFV